MILTQSKQPIFVYEVTKSIKSIFPTLAKPLNIVSPEMGLAGVRVLPLSLYPQAGVVVPAQGIVREVLYVTPAMRFSKPSFENSS